MHYFNLIKIKTLIKRLIFVSEILITFFILLTVCFAAFTYKFGLKPYLRMAAYKSYKGAYALSFVPIVGFFYQMRRSFQYRLEMRTITRLKLTKIFKIQEY
jgi:hypothetical protein